MNIQHLKYAVEVEKQGSISKAADSLYMGQPNLSKSIKELENSLDIKIFTRTPKGVNVTEKGKEFLEYAKNILAQIDEIESYYQKSSTEKQSFRISVPRASYIARAFSNFVQEVNSDKDMEMDFIETNSMRTINSITEGNYNLGIIRYQTQYEPYFERFLEDKGLRVEVIWEFSHSVLLSRESELASRKSIAYEELEDYIEIIQGDSSVPYLSAVDKRRTQQRTNSRKRIYIYERGSQLELLTSLPSTYMWVAPMPSDVLERDNLALVECETGDTCKDVLIYPADYELNKLERMFLKKMGEVKAEFPTKDKDA